jgi:hypothetical protein
MANIDKDEIKQNLTIEQIENLEGFILQNFFVFKN